MSARILLLDIETAPITAHVWGLRDQFVSLNQIRSQPRVIGFGAKWYGEKGAVKFYSEYHGDRPGTEAKHHDMVAKAWELLNDADLVVHYNGTSFDIPHLNSEFAQAGHSPPAPFKNIDLYRVARRAFRLPSYKLEYVSRWLGIGGKLPHTGHQLWVDCLEGDDAQKAKAWKLMARYCKQDVALLGPLYEALRPWMGNHPNLALYAAPEGDRLRSCPTCGSPRLQSRGWQETTTRRYPRFQCQACGAWTRGTASDREATVDLTGVVR